MKNTDLLSLAREAMKNSYSPYSNFKVGAALLGDNGKIYTGTNIENASFGATICAERAAIAKAVSDGCTHIKAIAIASGSDNMITPCGICRQVILEFSDPDTNIICGTGSDDYREFKISDLLPHAFQEF